MVRTIENQDRIQFIYILQDLGHLIHLLWIPSSIEINGNEKAEIKNQIEL